MSGTDQREQAFPSLGRLAAVAAVSAAFAFGAVYVTLGRPDNAVSTGPMVKKVAASDAPVRVAQSAAPAVVDTATTGAGPLNTGDMAAFVYKADRPPLAEVKFLDGKGNPRTLADWRGKIVLLNLWATWCAPCRKEMPALDRLNRELGGTAFEVVALGVDRTGLDGAKKFLDSINVNGLGLYADPTAKAGSELRAIGMPTTILIGKDGREIGRLVGPAEWDSPDAKRLILSELK
jgi:thiol-disulfide isomerase/thioredoxin